MNEPTSSAPGNQAGGGTRGWLRRPTATCLALALLTLAIFLPVIHFQFINYDDPDYVSLNPQVQAGLTWRGVRWAFSSTHASNWHPLTWLSHMADAQLFGAGPTGPHLVNLLIHAANTVLLFLVLRQLSGAHWRSAWVAALFAVHPLHVESVAWVAERKDVLSTLFGLLTLLFYGRYVQKSKVALSPPLSRPTGEGVRPVRRSRGESGRTGEGYSSPPGKDESRARGFGLWTPDYGLALVFFALGLMSKPMLVSLPLVMLLLDYWPLERVRGAGGPVSGARCEVPGVAATARQNLAPPTSPLALPWTLVREKIPFFLLSGISCVLTFLAQAKSGAVLGLINLPLGDRIANAFVSYARYLGKLVWPTNLALPYPYPGSWPVAFVVLAVVLVVILCAAALLWRRPAPYVFVGWFWFLGTMIPVIGLIQVGGQSMADRYTYVPAMGLFIALAWGAGTLSARWRLHPIAVGSVALLVLAASAARTVDQLSYWRNSGTLFRHVIEVSNDNYMAHDLLGYYLTAEGRADEAAEQFQAALRINPRDPKALDNLGSYYLSHGPPEAAMQYFQRALRDDPRFLHAWLGLGSAHEKLKQYTQAIECYQNARRLAPAFPQPLNYLGNAFYARKQYGDAIQCYEASLKLLPGDARVLNNLGSAYFKESRVPEAIHCFETALQLKPDYAEAHLNLAAALSQSGNFDEAVRHYNDGLRLNADNADARLELSRVLVKLGRREEAIKHLKEALRIKPDFAAARQELQALQNAAPK